MFWKDLYYNVVSSRTEVVRIQKRGAVVILFLIVLFLLSMSISSALSTTTTFYVQRGDSEFIKFGGKTYTFSLKYLNKDFAYFNLDGIRDSIDLKETKTYKLKEDDYKTKVSFLSQRRAEGGPRGRFSIEREYTLQYGSGITHSIDHENAPQRIIDELRTGETAVYRAGPYFYKIDVLYADSQYVAVNVNREFDIAKKSEDKFYGRNKGLLRFRVMEVRKRNIGHEVTVELYNENYQIEKKRSYIIER
ncbi:hypothetical protein GF371_05405 [Candidatus Woesearchaeota archaeon]|nr:hypothetical protein [Candidatus Woesearchaeota archaeon]